MRKIILSILGILLILVSVFLAKSLVDNKKSIRPKSVKVVKTVITKTVKNAAIPIIVSANGNLVAKQKVVLFAEVQGVFRRSGKLFKEGQAYAAGETIIGIDASEYKASVQSAKSGLYNTLIAIMPDLRLDYPDVFPKWQAYLKGFDMSKNIPKLPKMMTENERFFISGRDILTTYYNVKNLEQRLAKYNISASFSGVVTEALVTEGTLIRSGQKLGEYINPNVYELEVAISKNYSDLLKKGQKVVLSSLDSAAKYSGKVVRINGRVDLGTQTIKAYIEVASKELREGMYLEANLDAKKVENAIEVDRSLLLADNKIFVIQDAVLNVIDVLPVYFSDKTVVLKNVPNGTVIMSKPLIGAYTGMAVKIFQGQSANSKE